MPAQETAKTLFLDADGLKYAYRLIGNSTAGIGHSQGNIAPSIRSFAVLLPSLPTNQVDVSGFSMGGYVAQQLALDAPDVVYKLVLSGRSSKTDE